jgi:hypothetical protein
MADETGSEILQHEYDADICRRARNPELVPFRKVSTGEWFPAAGQCHQNATRWVAENEGHSVVRGWLPYLSCGPDFRVLTPHSLVRGPDGGLFDITPVGNYDEMPIRQFVVHHGSDEEFWTMAKDVREIRCLAGDPAPRWDPELALTGNFVDIDDDSPL